MKYLVLLFIVACSNRPYQQKPHSDSDLPFCMQDSECTVYRSRCGKFVAFNEKYADYVVEGFKKREDKVHCENVPDKRRYRTECRTNACELVELDR